VSPADARTRRYATLTFLRGALVSIALAVTAGLVAALHYVPGVSPGLASLGLSFTALRPLHTTFASAWIFLGGLAVVHRYLEDHAGPVTRTERLGLRAQVLLWAFAGAGVLVTLPLGITSGREYMGFHPLLSIPILLGWLLFVARFFRAVGRDFWTRPIYVTMWGVGCLFFVFTFLEQHAWLLGDVFAQPVVDLRLQWKACGTLVGSFNLFVYGSLIYLGERLTGDPSYGRSRLAYALFGVGLLNSFTNFAHHTYHLPQSELVKWISFVVSMTELILLARVVWDLVGALKQQVASPQPAASFFLSATKVWTAAMLFTSILLSVPPLNAVVHGTHVVTGHAMGTEIGIDTMVLLGAVAWLLGDGQAGAPAVRRWGFGLNVSAAILVAWLHVEGLAVGVTRYLGQATPAWAAVPTPPLFVLTGGGVALCVIVLLARWMRIAFRPYGDGSAQLQTGTAETKEPGFTPV
jgi:nitric oxide reductase subunit B